MTEFEVRKLEVFLGGTGLISIHNAALKDMISKQTLVL
jgi:hypothetical protein